MNKICIWILLENFNTITCNRVSSGKRKSSRNCLYSFIMGSKFLWRCPFLKSTGGQCHVINKFFFKRQVYLKVVKVCQNRFTFISKKEKSYIQYFAMWWKVSSKFSFGRFLSFCFIKKNLRYCVSSRSWITFPINAEQMAFPY